MEQNYPNKDLHTESAKISNSTRCAACKSLRRKCTQDCELAPYFPSNDPQRFADCHKIFGASNITKMLKQLPEHLREEGANCLSFEATTRVKDPVYGCVGIISQLQRHIQEVQTKIVKTKGEIALYHAQQHQQYNQEIVPTVGPGEQEAPYSWTGSSLVDPLFVDQLQTKSYHTNPTSDDYQL